MKLKFSFILFLFVLVSNLKAQKKVNVDLNFNIYKSIGKEIIKNYQTTDGYVIIEYYEKKRNKNPFISFTGNVYYPIFKKIHIGLQTGIYMIFKEIYQSYPPTNHFSIPLQATLKYEALNRTKFSSGVIVAAGINFLYIDEVWARYKNAALYNGSFYCKSGKSIFKIGVEKQVDNVIANLHEFSAYTNENLYKYKLSRVSGFISYGITIR